MDMEMLEEGETVVAQGEQIITDVGDVGEAAVENITKTASKFMEWVHTYFTLDNIIKIAGTVFIVLAVYIIYKLLVRWIKKVPKDKLPPHRSLAIVKLVQYVAYALMIMTILSFFGVKLSAIWGAAGVAGVALAFAAQTSVSNIISGIFIVAEKTMKPGDLITVEDDTGIVDVVGLLSVQIHTLDNQLIRIPNSTIINSSMKNTSYYPKRRMTISVDVSYDTDMEYALETIQKVPQHCKSVLKDPAPAAWFEGFGESGIKLTLAVWFKTENFFKTKNEVFIAIKKVFDESKIEIPYNKIDVNFPDAKAPVKAAKTTKTAKAAKRSKTAKRGRR